MGEVYRARDTTLNRTVALKILPDLFASDPDRLARFSREAQTLAALNHPNIAQIYGVHESVHKGARIRALVMEFVEGDDLAQSLAVGPLPQQDALAAAAQIAEALETAHEQGIIHRDLKPANIKRRPDGAVKVLDFGLAKAMDPAAGIGVPASSLSPTLTSPALMTGIGMVLGTAAYMSPEQAKGRAADKRSDIWAYGCVLFEMLTGRPLFTGESVTEVLASVMKDTPALDTLPPDTPVSIRHLLARCLERDPRQRLRDIGEARIAIARSAMPESAPQTTQGTAAAPPRALPPARTWLPWLLTTTATVAAAVATFFWAPWQSTPSAALLRLTAQLGVDASLVTDRGASMVLSPDGSLLAFVAQTGADQPQQLYLRPLASLKATVVTATTGARDPFFSPDGQWIGFFADGKLKKVAVSGGSPVELAAAQNPRGGTWADDDTIVFQPFNAASPNAGALMRVQSSGGTPELAIPLDGKEVTQRWPQVLPGGAVLFTSHISTTLGYEDASIVVQKPGGERHVLVRGGYFARYLPSGHIVYMHQGTLFAAPFDLGQLALTRAAVPVLDGVDTNASFGGTQFSVATNGTLVYLPGEVRTRATDAAPLLMFDRAGQSRTLRSKPEVWDRMQFASDGHRLVTSLANDTSVNVWILDTTRDILSKVTFGGVAEVYPAWSADDKWIAYTTSQDSGNIYVQRADGAGTPQRLTNRASSKRGMAFHPSGRWMMFSDYDTRASQNWDLMSLPLELVGGVWKTGQPTPFLSTAAAERFPAFSPDGRWVAYLSDETGVAEVYVRPFPGPGGKWQISTGGGASPQWSRTRPELVFETPAGGDVQLMAASYAVRGDQFVAERARPWSSARMGQRGWALHPDGVHVAGVPALTQAFMKRDTVVVFTNFLDEVRRRTAASR